MYVYVSLCWCMFVYVGWSVGLRTWVCVCACDVVLELKM